MDQFLGKYPKYRADLPENISRIHKKVYQNNREGVTVAASISQKMESWLHKMVAKDVVNSSANKDTLEIGAGTLNQLEYETGLGAYDICEPFVELYQNKKHLTKIRYKYKDLSEIPYSNMYDRITSVATLEHILDLPFVIAKSALHLNVNGKFRASIPSEGSFLWYFGWRFTTGLEFWIKYRLNYKHLIRYEHVNTYKEINDVLSFFYKKVNVKVYGISKSISFYQFYECSMPDLVKCKSYIDLYKNRFE